MGTGVLLTIGSLFYIVCLSIAYFKKIKLNTLENRIFKISKEFDIIYIMFRGVL